MAPDADVRVLLRDFGAVPGEVLSLAEESPDLIEYLDLIAPENSGQGEPSFLSPDAVIQHQGRALLYVLRADRLASEGPTQRGQLQGLRRAIACRGDEAPLLVVRPGEVFVFGTHSRTRLPEPKVFKAGQEAASSLIRDLLEGTDVEVERDLLGQPVRSKQDAEAMHELLFRLLTEVSTALLRTAPLRGKTDEVLSLVGRALFTRFLIDRKILNASTFPAMFRGRAPEDAFGDPESAARTCRWLEDNFNGELLPLPEPKARYREYFERLDTPTRLIFKNLSKVLYRTTAEGQMLLDWGFLDFAHVPVGLLSQVYERYAHEHFGKVADKESVHYTPHHIAKFVVDQAFEGLTVVPRDKARVLDPAAGAGVFLVLAFRRLIAERWRATGKRPEKEEIRQILYDQVRGFDINEHALTLSALSLYLTALELDPNPFPPEALTFRKLGGEVLICARHRTDEAGKPVLGSLGPAISSAHNGQYHIVGGNPPWTAWAGEGSNEINTEVESLIRRIAQERSPNLADIAREYKHPDKLPDIPFVWKAMEWATADGVIAFVMHGRLLFKRSEVGAKAREALFRSLRVTGILNGAGLDATEVWPSINQPFCLLFARNKLAAQEDLFYFVSPQRERELNRKSIIRVDYQAAQPVDWRSVAKTPYLLKTLFRGNALDVELIGRLAALTEARDAQIATPLAKYWDELGLVHGGGYQVAGRGQSADELLKLKGVKFDRHVTAGRLIDSDSLAPFTDSKLHRPRDPALYRTPLVLMGKAPGDLGEKPRAHIAFKPRPIIYSESFVGYSAGGHVDGEFLASHLFLLINSDLFPYYLLMTSALFGVERRVIYAEDVEELPFVRSEHFSASEKRRCIALGLGYCKGSVSDRHLNDWIARIYRLEPADREVIEDALTTQMPFQLQRDQAEARPTSDDMKRFAERVRSLVSPIAKRSVPLRVLDLDLDAWGFLALGDEQAVPEWGTILQAIADASGSSRVVVQQAGGVLIGMPRKNRYWTGTRARMLARDVLQDFTAAIAPQ